MWKEFKPAFRFLLIFLGLYLGGNIVYGLFITWCGNTPDPFTSAVAYQTEWLLKAVGYTVTAVPNTQGPTVFLRDETPRTVLNIYEGCNGLNVMIVFAAFIVAYAGDWKKMRWFLPAGILVIHIANIIRLAQLYYVAIRFQHYFYYVHKYVFTAAIYFVVFLLWLLWVTRLNGKAKASA